MFSGISLIGVVRIQSKAIFEPRTTFSDSFLVEHEKKIYIVKRNKNSLILIDQIYVLTDCRTLRKSLSISSFSYGRESTNLSALNPVTVTASFNFSDPLSKSPFLK